MFRFGKSSSADYEARQGDFGYLARGSHYLDSACQTLRPQQVIDAEMRYYTERNACGGRVKYPWGVSVDRDVEEARAALLAYVGKSPKEYAVAFTLNTTYGINLVLSQLPAFDRIVTSDIEHNSVFLPTISWARTRARPRLVLPRTEDGSVVAKPADLAGAVLLLNTASNIDGRILQNAPELADAVHREGGILLLDAAQSMGHDPELLRRTDFDAAFGSAHKAYAPSLGFVVIRRSLLERLPISFLGGGTVSGVREADYDLLSGNDLHSRLESGLQNWAGIIGLRSALAWMEAHPELRRREKELSHKLFDGLSAIPRVKLLNTAASPVQSFCVDGLDAHKLALFLGEKQIMCRSGSFCCHHYLIGVRRLPPLLRVSLGYHNTEEDIDVVLGALSSILHAF